VYCNKYYKTDALQHWPLMVTGWVNNNSNSNNNNNNNNNWWQCLKCCHMTQVISRVRPVHLMNVGHRQAAADLQTKPTEQTWVVSLPVGCCSLYLPSAFITALFSLKVVTRYSEEGQSMYQFQLSHLHCIIMDHNTITVAIGAFLYTVQWILTIIKITSIITGCLTYIYLLNICYTSKYVFSTRSVWISVDWSKVNYAPYLYVLAAGKLLYLWSSMCVCLWQSNNIASDSWKRISRLQKTYTKSWTTTTIIKRQDDANFMGV